MRNLICLKNDRENDIVGFSLFGLYLNNIDHPLDILLIDNSIEGIFSNPFIRAIWDLLAGNKKNNLIYIRDTEKKTVGQLQYNHYLKAVELKYDFLYWLDSDIFLNTGMIKKMIDTIISLDDAAFLQGNKIDITSKQNYFNDINIMNKYNVEENLIDLFFGDTSNIIIPVKNLQEIDWSRVIEIKDKRVITGTDTLITGQLTINKRGYGLTNLNGFHLSYHQRVQTAEIYADWLRIETMKDIIPIENLKKIYKDLL